MANLGYCQLIAPEALPEGFWQTYCNEDEREPGDEHVEHLVCCLEQAARTYGACWLLYESIDDDFVHGQVIEVMAGDFVGGHILPIISTSRLRGRHAILPIFFTAEELHVVLQIEPHPIAPVVPSAARLHLVKSETGQDAVLARPTPRTIKTCASKAALCMEIPVSTQFIDRMRKELHHSQRPRAFRLPSWLIHFAVDALVQMQQSVEELLERRRLHQQECVLRALLREKKPFHASVSGASDHSSVLYTIQVNVYSYQEAA
jgi:hypothetical protein